MVNQIAIGLGAGAASALLYFAVSSGTALAFVLFYVAPLPVMVAGLGWGAAVGAIAAVSGGIVTSLVTSAIFGLGFFIACSAPAAWLARLAVMSRPLDPANAEAGVEWYPAGRLMLWSAGMGATIVFVAIAIFGGGIETFREAVAAAINRLFEEGLAESIGLPADADREALTHMLAGVLPPVSAGVWTLTMAFNLWLGARIALASGRLGRPMPDLSRIDYPTIAAAALAGGLVLSFFPGLIGLAGGVVAASFMIAYLILGLAVIHALTQGMNARPLLLGALYATILMLAWTIPVIAMFGVAETFMKFRDRARQGRSGPPAGNS